MNFVLNISNLRQKLETFRDEVALDTYRNFAGLSEKSRSGQVYDRYRELFTRENVNTLNRHCHLAPPTEHKRLSYLRCFLTEQYLKSKNREYEDEIRARKMTSFISVKGTRIPFRKSMILMMNERDRARRSMLVEAQSEVIRGINPLILEKVRKLHECSKKLGYRNYVSMYEEIKNLDLTSLENIASDILRRTEDIYVEELSRTLGSLDITPDEAEYHDLSFIQRAKTHDSYFPRERAVKTLKDTMHGLGLDSVAKSNIEIDVEDRPTKFPGYSCHRLKIPHRIVIVTAPRGGYQDYRFLLHEGGHAQQFGNISPDLGFEFRCLGDSSTFESFALLFEDLVADREWLSTYVEDRIPSGFLRFALLDRLIWLRKMCATFVYRLELHKRFGSSDIQQVFASTMSECLKVRRPEDRYLGGLGTGFLSAQFIQALILKSYLQDALKGEFGAGWFRNAQVGDYLSRMWVGGSEHDIPSLLEIGGISRLDSETLLRELKARQDDISGPTAV